MSKTAKIYVTLKKRVLDPQGNTVKHALNSLGFKGVQDVRLGKYMEIKLNGETKSSVEDQIRKMCDKLLINPVIEDYTYEIEDE